MKNRLERIQNGLWGKKKTKGIISNHAANDDTWFIGAAFQDDLRNTAERTEEQI
ncbi:hypothetical protein [Muriicola marianensis]|uniref:Uncharacterized protein n=1 Tax=Muriicola marianensis TaxID=1324801 RepID=A0ABQ1R3G9_9FLAO|nr:hypothetical protein [Muriicola marianensis]GGD53315.1 hypothetical protein GCM10011361_19990 [Muriicola marianensis]